MKKIEKHITKNYSAVRFYLEDLRELESIFKNNFDKYTIQDGEYEYKDLDELIDQGKSTIDHVKFSGEDKISDSKRTLGNMTFSGEDEIFDSIWYDTKLELNIDKNSSTLYSFNVDDKVEGIIARVEKIINNKSRVKPRFINYTNVSKFVLSYSLIGSIIILATGKEIFKNGNSIYKINPIISFPIVGILLLILLYSFVSLGKKSIIKLMFKNQEHSFVRRNKDQLLLSIISAIIGGIITFAIIYITKNV